jgi:hypothetical protein
MRMHRMRLAEQDAGASLASTRAEHAEIRRKTTELLHARRDEQDELRSYQLALENASSLEVEQQRKMLATMRTSLLQQSDAAEKSKGELRAAEASLSAERMHADEEAVRLQVDRALLDTQTERQREAAARFQEEARSVPQITTAVRAPTSCRYPAHSPRWPLVIECSTWKSFLSSKRLSKSCRNEVRFWGLTPSSATSKRPLSMISDD